MDILDALDAVSLAQKKVANEEVRVSKEFEKEWDENLKGILGSDKYYDLLEKQHAAQFATDLKLCEAKQELKDKEEQAHHALNETLESFENATTYEEQVKYFNITKKVFNWLKNQYS